MYKYQIYNLEVESEIELPCNSSINANKTLENEHKVRVLYRNEVFNQNFNSVSWIGTKHGFLRGYDLESGIVIGVLDYLRLYINKNGSEIYVECKEEHIPRAAAYIIGIGMSICMFFKEYLPIHAASIDVNGKLIGILADSGTGKSTLLWNFLQQGAHYFGDDVLPIRMNSNSAMAIPSVALQPKITKESASKLNIDCTEYKEIIPGVEKYLIPMNDTSSIFNPKEVSCLFVLKPFSEETICEPQIKKVDGIEALRLLLENTHAWWTIPPYLRKASLDKYFDLSNRIPIFIVNYSKTFDSIPLVIEKIKETADC